MSAETEKYDNYIKITTYLPIKNYIIYIIRLNIKKAVYDTVNRRHPLTKALAITLLLSLILANVASAVDDPSGTNSQNSVSWNQKGVILAASGRLDEAITAYDRAIKINPYNSAGWYNRGNALQKLGKYDEALNSYAKAIEINPQYSHAWNNAGHVLKKMSKYDEAKKAYDKTIESDPGNLNALKSKEKILSQVNNNLNSPAPYTNRESSGQNQYIKPNTPENSNPGMVHEVTVGVVASAIATGLGKIAKKLPTVAKAL